MTLAARATGDALVIEVIDQGPGIAYEDRPRVFERFTRGERATGGGTGLGMAIARWVVELHGGTIEVLDGGTRHGGGALDVGGAPPMPGCRIRVSLPATA